MKIQAEKCASVELALTGGRGVTKFGKRVVINLLFIPKFDLIHKLHVSCLLDSDLFLVNAWWQLSCGHYTYISICCCTCAVKQLFVSHAAHCGSPGRPGCEMDINAVKRSRELPLVLLYSCTAQVLLVMILKRTLK